MNNMLLVLFDSEKPELFLVEKAPFSCTPATDVEQPDLEKYNAIAVISARFISSHTREIPARQKKYLNKTLPYLLEDDLAASIEVQHIASQAIDSNRIRAIVMARELLTSLISQVKSMGIELQALYVDADLITLGATSEQGIALVFADQNLIKTRQGTIATVDDIGQLDIPGSLETQHADTHKTEFIARALCQVSSVKPPPVNVLQGEFAPRGALGQQAALVHRLGLTVSVILLAQVMYWAIVGSQYSGQAEQLKAQSEQTYRHYFPHEKTIIDIQGQAQGHISQANGNRIDSTFLSLVSDLGEAIQQSPDQNRVIVKSLRYQTETGQLRVEVDAPSIPALQAVETQLQTTEHLKIDMDQINQKQGSVTGRLSLSAIEDKK